MQNPFEKGWVLRNILLVAYDFDSLMIFDESFGFVQVFFFYFPLGIVGETGDYLHFKIIFV